MLASRMGPATTAEVMVQQVQAIVAETKPAVKVNRRHAEDPAGDRLGRVSLQLAFHFGSPAAIATAAP
jgi:hypothetical protein